MATAKKTLKIARSQIGVCEKPAGSNRQPYGKAYGMNGVFWCAQYVWWCAWKADGKKTKTIAKNASAAYIHEQTVSKYGGKWIMKKTKQKNPRKEYLKKAKQGDIVSFDFGAMDAVRDHVGLVDYVSGNYVVCLEGNTSKKGSQSNGGMVCEQRRHYTEICCASRPRYSDKDKPEEKYTGMLPTLPKRGYFQKGDKGSQVKILQKFLDWCELDTGGIDGEFGQATKDAVKTFQRFYGLSVDGGWGKECQKQAKTMCK